MKPARRSLLIALGVIVAVCAAGLAVALAPGFQRWMVRRIAADHPDVKLELDAVSVGFSGASLQGVRLEQHGLRIQVDRLDADFSLLQVLFSRRLVIHQLTAGGLILDASRLSRAKAEAAVVTGPAAAPGVLARLELPVEVVLDDCRIEGRALLPGGAGRPTVAAEYKISGGKFAPGQEGSLLLTATVRNSAADAHVAALNAQVSLRVTQTSRRTFARVGLTAVVDAEGRSFSEKTQLKISAGLARDVTGENYTVSVDTVIRGTTENLLALQATLPAGQTEYAGQWTLKGRTAQLEPFFLGAALPDFDARGEGRFAFTPSTRAVSLQGSLDAGVSRLEVIEPGWRAIGPVKLQAQFDAAEADGIAQLRQLSVRLAGDQPVLTVQAARAAMFNLKERRLQVGGGETGEILKLELHGLPLAWVRPFVHGTDISGGMISGSLTVSSEKDRLLARVTEPLRIGALTVVHQGQLLLSKADITARGEAMLGDQALQLRFDELNLKTPVGDSLALHGTVALPLVAGSTSLVAVGFSSDLPTLLAPWLPSRHLRISGDAEIGVAANRLELHQLKAGVAGPGGESLVDATMLHPFNLDLAGWRAVTEQKGATDLLRVAVDRLPLDALPLTQPDTRLEGLVNGEFVLTADGDKLAWRATAPVKVTGVALSQNDRPMLSDLSFEARPSVELSGKLASAAQTGDIVVRSASGATLATFKGEATRSAEAGLRGTLTFNVEVPALASQPCFAGAQAVSEGHASGEVRVVHGGASSQLEARLTINGLVARESGQPLPVANLSFRGVTQENGRISVEAPLLLDRAGQRSDLNFGLEVTPQGRVMGLDGRLTGEHVELADLISVLSVFSASTAATAKVGGPAVVAGPRSADVTPAWGRFNGKLLVDLKSATAGKEWSMTGLTGLVVIDPARVALQKLEAAFGNKSRLAAKGDLRFTGGDNQPYQLAGDFSLTEFDAGKLFKAIEPTRAPTVEGIFSVTGTLAGLGATVDQTIEQTRGRFELTSRQGIFRGLQRTTNKVSMTSKAVELGASVLGTILGSDKGTKVAEKVAGTAYFVDQLAQGVGELNYDQLSLRLVRDESLDIALEDFSLVSPEVRLLGKGAVNYVADKPLLEQPLTASLSFSARGKTEQTFGKLHLMDGTRDELGYARAQLPVTIGGTLARPDPSAFFLKVATTKLSELVTPEN